MKYLKITTFLFFLIALLFISCEKDDICGEGTPTTPQLIVRFYDANAPEETKPVTDMLVYGLNDLSETVFFNSIALSTTDSITVPLRTGSDVTRLVFHKDLDTSDFQTGNLDVIATNYEREDVYVSRACGFKTIFNNFQTNLEIDPNNWIVSVEIVVTTVENQTSAHVKIYH